MAYSALARELRRCHALCKDGRPCPRYAVWSDPRHLCVNHGGRVAHEHVREKTAYTPCRCVAYPFPHRPGGALCEWPDAPKYQSLQSSGEHYEGYKSTRSALAQWSMQPLALLSARLFRPS